MTLTLNDAKSADTDWNKQVFVEIYPLSETCTSFHRVGYYSLCLPIQGLFIHELDGRMFFDISDFNGRFNQLANLGFQLDSWVPTLLKPSEPCGDQSPA